MDNIVPRFKTFQDNNDIVTNNMQPHWLPLFTYPVFATYSSLSTKASLLRAFNLQKVLRRPSSQSM
eukprot:131461-Amphidinium_carterae.1